MIEWTRLNLHEILDMNIIEFFNLTCFNIDWNDWEAKQIKKMTKHS